VTADQVTPGLNDAVYHGNAAYTPGNVPHPNPNSGLTDNTLGGTNAPGGPASPRGVRCSNTPNYSFVNTHDRFVYSGGQPRPRRLFSLTACMGHRGCRRALRRPDSADVDDTNFRRRRVFSRHPPANDGGTYTVTLGARGRSQSLSLRWPGTELPGRNAGRRSARMQGANAGTPSFQISLPQVQVRPIRRASPSRSCIANGYGGANLKRGPPTAIPPPVSRSPIHRRPGRSFQTTPANEPAPPTAPTLDGHRRQWFK